MSEPLPLTPSQDPAGSRPPPRRATQACLSCRQRKVRCDVSFRTGPCNNCQLDGTECRVSNARRRPRRPENHEIISLDRQVVPSSSGQFAILDGTVSGALAAPGLPLHRVHALSPDLHRQTSTLILPSAEQTQGLSSAEFTTCTRQLMEACNHNRRSNSPPESGSLSGRCVEELPDFIEDFEVQGVETLRILQQSDVFVLLPLGLQRIVFARYEGLVHPLLPMLDVDEFRRAISGQALGTKISLLLYHSVMFIGLSCVERDTILQLAGTSKQAARLDSYRKAKVLLDLNVEKDREIICQSCLLLTGNPKQDEAKDATYWTGVAISQAHSLKLYRLPPSPPRAQERNNKGILWWCVLMKECDASMCMDHPPRVWPCSSPMPTMRDFGLEEEQASQTRAGRAALTFILKAKLCCRIFEILRTVYEEIQPWNNGPGNNDLPDPRQEMLFKLRSWPYEVPPELRYESLTRQRFSSSEPEIAWSMTISEIAYWSAHFVIYKDELWYFLTQERWKGTPSDQSEPPRHAAAQISRVLEHILACNMAQFLPSQTVIQILVAAFVLYRSTRCADLALREDSFRMLELCVQASDIVKDTYPFIYQAMDTFWETVRLLEERGYRGSQSSFWIDNDSHSSPRSYSSTDDIPTLDTPFTSTGDAVFDTSQYRNEPSQEVYEENSRLDEASMQFFGNYEFCNEWMLG